MVIFGKVIKVWMYGLILDWANGMIKKISLVEG